MSYVPNSGNDVAILAAPCGTGTVREFTGTLETKVRKLTGLVGEFYSRPGRRQELAVTSLMLTYGGGALMFWLHAIYRGEQGPPIADVFHWFLDSSLGCIALTPVLFVLIPLADAAVRSQYAGPSRTILRRAAITGAVFALFTAPGPLLHGIVAGRGTPLARLATRVFGSDPHVMARGLDDAEHSARSEVMAQLVVGLPVYIALTALSLGLLQAVRTRRAAPRTSRVAQPATW